MKKICILLLVSALLAGLCLPAAAGSAEAAGPAPEAPQTAETAQPAPSALDDPLLTLVNPWNTVPADWTAELKSIGSGHFVDETCYDDLTAMLKDCRAAGLSPVVRSSYRTQKTQEQLYSNKVSQMKARGYKDQEARAKAATIVAVPGTSEHQLGWAVDIVDSGYRTLDEKQAGTPTQQWLMEHCWEYGFILRYPEDKSQVTGIIYEPWHYRYVGRDNAKAIQASGLCLEEYLEQLAAQEAEAQAAQEAQQQLEALKEAVHEALSELGVDTARYIFRLLTGGARAFETVADTAPAAPGE